MFQNYNKKSVNENGSEVNTVSKKDVSDVQVCGNCTGLVELVHSKSSDCTAVVLMDGDHFAQ